jgi:hypothetical protein
LEEALDLSSDRIPNELYNYSYHKARKGFSLLVCLRFSSYNDLLSLKVCYFKYILFLPADYRSGIFSVLAGRILRIYTSRPETK